TSDPSEETRRALDHVEEVLRLEGPEHVAALILEPVVGTNGVIIYPDGYLEGLRRITEQYQIMLIFDEVMTGFGRTGAAFAAHRFGVTPDMITFAKGVTSGYVPLGGVLVREAFARHFDRNVLWCGHTYSGHPLAVAIGLAVQEVYQEENLFARAREIEGWLRPPLEELSRRHKVVGEVRGIGAFFALELVRDQASRVPLASRYVGDPALMRDFHAALLRRGVYAFGRHNILLVAPPLTITREEIDLGMEALDAALGELVLKIAA
ncbi:MAG: aminotransferase class III-fold pyridoxal phosphate-dependent enzyme, partial [Armatimonadota bacterium]|nr:aminotransferase class III-fold pyridoxal phosphate-dependent enzyme [Armatimonadota bacterium]